ncbi:Efflux pump himE like protein [Verticillium longisporum]|uniref:Efflux pump himE like protein n=1 Tax=Verticillium longisporum TaxID=100787 RepID=A0A8I3AK34_VERLO|nr:Efflux pump himE like protein [Verticillium longisporum]
MVSTPPPNLIPFGADANCTLDLCPLEWSILRYQPSIAANTVFITLFGVSMVLHTIQGFHYKAWTYASCMAAGCILEIVGYVGRLILHHNPFSFEAFLMQITIYILLSQMIYWSDRSISRFDPRVFYWIFIPADIISLVLQATGGALSAVGTEEDEVQTGVDISLAGLNIQVIALTTFVCLFADYVIAYFRKHGQEVTRRMKVFLFFLFLAVIFILIRCAYRIVELKDGYHGVEFRNEAKFIALESSIMSAAIFLLNVAHPGRVFGVAQMTGKDARSFEMRGLPKTQTQGKSENNDDAATLV